MWVYDRASLAFLAVNDAAVARYGYPRDEFLALTTKDLLPPADQGTAARDRGQKHRTKSGELLDVETETHPVLFGDRPAWLVLATMAFNLTVAFRGVLAYPFHTMPRSSRSAAS